MGQNAFEELSTLMSIRQISLQQRSQPYWATSWNSYQSQWEYFVNEVAKSIWCSFPFAGDHSPPQKHTPKQFHTLGKSQDIQLAMQI